MKQYTKNFSQKKPKLIRLTTIDKTLDALKGQLNFMNNDFNVIAIASDTGKLDEIAKREEIRSISVPMRREINLKADLKSLWTLYRTFVKEKPWIVHANSPKGSLLSMIAALIARVPNRIYTVTGLRFETTTGNLRHILILMEKITCACATKVIPEGDGVKNTLLREKVTRKPLQKVLNGNINGVDLEYFARTDEVLEKAKKLKEPDVFSFIFIGRMVRDKGVNELVQAFNKLSQKKNNVKLILLGDFEDDLDPVLPETKSIIDQNKNIYYAGFQSDVRPYLAASDVLILPSYREGYPNVVLQAGAMGLPCIVTDINGCNEIIINEVNGTIIPKGNIEMLYNAMIKMIECESDTKMMASQARKYIASRYIQQDVWQATLEMYNAMK